jgi:hypothetical protein
MTNSNRHHPLPKEIYTLLLARALHQGREFERLPLAPRPDPARVTDRSQQSACPQALATDKPSDLQRPRRDAGTSREDRDAQAALRLQIQDRRLPVGQFLAARWPRPNRDSLHPVNIASAPATGDGSISGSSDAYACSRTRRGRTLPPESLPPLPRALLDRGPRS